MSISMAVIVVIMIAVVLPTGLCTYNRGTPDGGAVTEVDERTFLQMESNSSEFPLVVPVEPQGWTANSARRSAVGDSPAPVVGYVTADSGFLQLTQTDVQLDDAVREVDTDVREQIRTEDIDGAEVRVFHSDESDVRDIWAFERGDVTYLISGSAPDEDFRELVSATLAGQSAGS